MIDYKVVMKAGMTGICCDWLAEVDIGSNPIIIVLQPSKFIVTIVIFHGYHHVAVLLSCPHSFLDPSHK